jgi:apolipoprotein N-acyltransferase
MQKYKYIPNIWTITTVILLFFSLFDKPGGSYIAIISPIPFLFGLHHERGLQRYILNSAIYACAYAYGCMQWMFVPAQNLLNKDIIDALLIFIFLCPLAALHFIVFGVIHYLTRDRMKHKFFFPFFSAAIYTLFDWFYMFGDTTLGTFLYQSPELMTLASYGGVFLLTFIIILSAELFCYFVIFKKNITAALAPMITFIILSFLTHSESRSDHYIKIAMIQTNDSPAENIAHFQAPENRSYLSIERLINNLKSFKTDASLLILPESVFPPYLHEPQSEIEYLHVNAFKEIHQRSKKDLIFGTVISNEDNRSNALTYWPQEGESSSYIKRKLMLYGELIPGANLFPILYSVFYKPYINSAGNEAVFFKHNDYVFSAVICNEIFYTSVVQQSVRDDVKWLIHSGNETWLQGTLGHHIILASTRLRAVEFGIPIIKVANYGNSVVVSPSGHLIERLPLGEEVFKTIKLPLERRLTFYSQHPNLIYVLLFTIFFIGLYLIFKKSNDLT